MTTHRRLVHLDDLDEFEQARVSVAERIRDLTHALMGHTQTTTDLGVMADELERLAAMASTGEPVIRSITDWASQRSSQEPPADGELFPNHLDRPVSGAANPWSVPLDVVRRGDRVATTVDLGPAFEGAPTRSHGGVVSAIYDDLAGFILALNQTMAFTAWLKIDYVAATPLGVPITFTAWLDRAEGRKLHMAGECVDDAGAIITRMTALFVTPNL